ncbi:hypothetical protein Tco_1392766 [Tanacetum coccineum]
MEYFKSLPSKTFSKMTTLVLLVRKESNTRPPVRQIRSIGDIVMPELHNKGKLLKERIGPLLKAARTMLADSFLPTLWYKRQIDGRLKRQEKEANEEAEALRKEFAQETENLVIQEGAAKASSTNIFSTVSTPAKASSIFYYSSLEMGAVADFTNLETVVNVSPIPTSRIISSHPSALILGDPTSAVQTRSKVNKSSGAHAFVSYVQKQRRNNHKDFHHFQNTESVDTIIAFVKKLLAHSGYQHKKDDRDYIDKNKARFSLTQGHRQVEGIDYEESIKVEMLKISSFNGAKIDEESVLVLDSDYVGANLDEKSKTVGSISWQETHFLALSKSIPCANFNNRRHNNVAASKLLWGKFVIQNQMLYYRHLDAKKKFVMYPRFISIFLDKQLASVPVPLDHFPVNALTSKVFSFMVKKGKHFSGKVTPLFASMLVQPTEDEGAPSERPSEAQPTPSPAHTSEVPIEPQTDSSPAHTSEVPIEQQTDPSPRPSPSTIIPDSLPESSGGNLGGHSSSDKSLSGNEGEMTLQSVYDLCLSLCAQVSDQAKEIQHLKAQIKKLKKQAKPVIKHHRAWMQSVSLKQRLQKEILKETMGAQRVLIKKMNEKGIDSSKNEMVKEESKEEVKEESKEEESNRKRKLGTRKKMKSRKRRFIQNISEDDSEKEKDELRLYLTIAPDEEKEVDYEILDRKYPIKECKTEYLGTKLQVDKAEHLEEINQNMVIRSNGQKRYFITSEYVLSIFDRVI